jgi:chromosomal replication initiator protein
MPEQPSREWQPWFRIIGAGAPTIKDIQVVTAEFYGIPESDMRSHRRDCPVARIRQVAMYLAKATTPKTFPEIGRRFGGRDHTTAMHAVRRIKALMEMDRELADEVAEIKFRLECL